MKRFNAMITAALLVIAPIFNAYAGTESLLASAVRAATTNTADQVTTNYRGVYVFAKVTAVPGGDTLTFTIQGKDVDGVYYTILASTASAASGTVTLKVYPGLPNTANVSTSDALPDIWRVAVTHSGAGNFTYSIVANTLK